MWYRILRLVISMDKKIVNSNKVILCPCRTPEEVLAARGVKPTLSPNLNTLALVEVIKPFTLAYYAEVVQNFLDVG